MTKLSILELSGWLATPNHKLPSWQSISGPDIDKFNITFTWNSREVLLAAVSVRDCKLEAAQIYSKSSVTRKPSEKCFSDQKLTRSDVIWAIERWQRESMKWWPGSKYSIDFTISQRIRTLGWIRLKPTSPDLTSFSRVHIYYIYACPSGGLLVILDSILRPNGWNPFQNLRPRYGPRVSS